LTLPPIYRKESPSCHVQQRHRAPPKPDIVSKLFGKAKPDQPSPATEPIPDPAEAQAAAPDAPPPTAPLADVDIAAVMDQLVSESGETLNWRTSIVFER